MFDVDIPLFWNPVVRNELEAVLADAPGPRVTLLAPEELTKFASKVVAATVVGDDCPKKSHPAITVSTNDDVGRISSEVPALPNIEFRSNLVTAFSG